MEYEITIKKDSEVKGYYWSVTSRSHDGIVYDRWHGYSKNLIKATIAAVDLYRKISR